MGRFPTFKSTTLNKAHQTTYSYDADERNIRNIRAN